MLTPTEARERLTRYADAARSRDKQAWAQGAAELADADGRTWLLLDGTARSWRWSSGAPISGTRDWLSPSLNEPTGFVASVTSMHVDGRLRQRAAQALSEQHNDLATLALAVRALDHVQEVRQVALRALASRTSVAEATRVLGVLTAGRDRVVAGLAFAMYADALLGAHEPPAFFTELARVPDRNVRRWAVSTGQALGTWSADDLARMLTSNRDQLVRRWAAGWLSADATPQQLRVLLQARYVDGVLLALTRLDDENLPDEALMPLLGHRSARVREIAQWRVRRRDLDVAGWYRAALLRAETGPSLAAACLAGLTDSGAVADLPMLESFLTHPSPVVRAQAVTSAAAYATLEELRVAVRPMLLDPSPRVAAAAARALARAGASVQDGVTAWSSEQPWSRRAAWRLARATGSWNKVLADTRAATDPDPILSGLGRAGLRNWLWADAATTWSRPSTVQRAELETGLHKTGLTPDEQRRVAFHAGLSRPTSPPASAPRPHDAEPPAGRPRLRLIPWRR